jgi:hypothetical protein
VERGYRGPDGTLPGPVATALAAAGGGHGVAGQDDPWRPRRPSCSPP